MAGILERPAAPTRHRLDVDAYYKMAEAGILADPCRVELIDGDIIDMTRIGSAHAGHTNRLVRSFSRAAADGSVLLAVQTPLRLDDYNEPQPDVMLLRPTIIRTGTPAQPTFSFSSKSRTVRSPTTATPSSLSTRASACPRSGSSIFRAGPSRAI